MSDNVSVFYLIIIRRANCHPHKKPKSVLSMSAVRIQGELLEGYLSCVRECKLSDSWVLLPRIHKRNCHSCFERQELLSQASSAQSLREILAQEAIAITENDSFGTMKVSNTFLRVLCIVVHIETLLLGPKLSFSHHFLLQQRLANCKYNWFIEKHKTLQISLKMFG